MGSHNLPSPPAEENKAAARKNTSKSTKSTSRISKRASVTTAAAHHHDHVTQSVGMDGRHKRVWKACERCRMKKTKCDGEFPCKRCKDDGLVCTAGVRKKVEYKQLPRGYAEVLENTQFALIATVHKLYNMVRNSQSWELGEPDLNDRGLPVIHDIAQKLGCIRPNSDIDLPAHSVFPEDEAGMTELARQLEEQQSKDGSDSQRDIKDSDSLHLRRNDRDSSSELDQSDLEDYRKVAFGNGNGITLSPQSFAGSNDFEFSPTVPEMDPSVMFASQAQSMPNYSNWSMPKTQTSDLAMHFLQQAENLQSMGIMGQSLVDAEYSTIKPDILSCPNPDVMMGLADPMMYTSFDAEAMRL
ncbi:Fluconazole resistance protein 1 [Conoideocrella luteorostrata]|uniref:Fluconazole resistance protein 1 n=1 Tax=Conoideocrella luteorostrata TaxID=1105319 RepID=A0AAJ0CRZ2_9HYPO|nr:Fluconazole resistance protein 1 [Conoideocrella luteorostrata]